MNSKTNILADPFGDLREGRAVIYSSEYILLSVVQYLWQTQPNKKVVCLTIRDVIRLICV